MEEDMGEEEGTGRGEERDLGEGSGKKWRVGWEGKEMDGGRGHNKRPIPVN